MNNFIVCHKNCLDEKTQIGQCTLCGKSVLCGCDYKGGHNLNCPGKLIYPSMLSRIKIFMCNILYCRKTKLRY